MANKRRIEEHLTDKPTKMWQGINHITKHGSSNVVPNEVALAGEVNHFFTRFEMQGPPIDTPWALP